MIQNKSNNPRLTHCKNCHSRISQEQLDLIKENQEAVFCSFCGEYLFLKKELVDNQNLKNEYLKDSDHSNNNHFKRESFEYFITIFAARIIYDSIILSDLKSKPIESYIEKLAHTLRIEFSEKKLNQEWLELFHNNSKTKFKKRYKKFQTILKRNVIYQENFLIYSHDLIKLMLELINYKNKLSTLKGIRRDIAEDLINRKLFEIDKRFPETFKQNLIIALSHLIYLKIRYIAQKREVQINLIDLHPNVIAKIAESIKNNIITFMEINPEYIKNLYGITLNLFNVAYQNLRTVLKASKIYSESFRWSLYELIKDVNLLLSAKQERKSLSNLEQIIFYELKILENTLQKNPNSILESSEIKNNDKVKENTPIEGYQKNPKSYMNKVSQNSFKKQKGIATIEDGQRIPEKIGSRGAITPRERINRLNKLKKIIIAQLEEYSKSGKRLYNQTKIATKSGYKDSKSLTRNIPPILLSIISPVKRSSTKNYIIYEMLFGSSIRTSYQDIKRKCEKYNIQLLTTPTEWFKMILKNAGNKPVSELKVRIKYTQCGHESYKSFKRIGEKRRGCYECALTNLNRPLKYEDAQILADLRSLELISDKEAFEKAVAESIKRTSNTDRKGRADYAILVWKCTYCEREFKNSYYNIRDGSSCPICNIGKEQKLTHLLCEYLFKDYIKDANYFISEKQIIKIFPLKDLSKTLRHHNVHVDSYAVLEIGGREIILAIEFNGQQHEDSPNGWQSFQRISKFKGTYKEWRKLIERDKAKIQIFEKYKDSDYYLIVVPHIIKRSARLNYIMNEFQSHTGIALNKQIVDWRRLFYNKSKHEQKL